MSNLVVAQRALELEEGGSAEVFEQFSAARAVEDLDVVFRRGNQVEEPAFCSFEVP